MINKTYLHPIRTSDYSKSVSSCHVLTSRPASNKIFPYLKLKLTVLSSGIFYPPLHSPKNVTSAIKLFFFEKIMLRSTDI